MIPAAAGPIALKRDIPVMASPLAAPLWSCPCFVIKERGTLVLVSSVT